MEKNEKFWEKAKELFTKPSTYIILLIVSLVIPFVINGIYKLGDKCSSPYLTKWNADDVLSFYGSYLSFIGTVVLGAVTVYQTKKAHKQTERANELTEKANQLTEQSNELSKQMQNLEQAHFISIVSVSYFKLFKRNLGEEAYVNQELPNRATINLTKKGFVSREFYHIDVIFENSGDYPIIDMFLRTGRIEATSNKTLDYGITDSTGALYIPPHSTQAVRFIIPSATFDRIGEYDFFLDLNFRNVFGYITPSILFIKDLENRNNRNFHIYQIKNLEI